MKYQVGKFLKMSRWCWPACILSHMFVNRAADLPPC